MKKEIDKIKKTNWSKNWSGEYSILSNSMAASCYGLPMKKTFGIFISGVFLTHKKGMTVCYLSDADREKFGRQLAKLIENDRKLPSLISQSLINETKELSRILKLPPTNFLKASEFNRLSNHITKLSVFQVANKESVNFISLKNLSRYRKLFGDARKYSEHVYVELEKFLSNILNLIAKRTKINLNQVKSLTYKEIEKLLSGEKIPGKNILSNRFNNSGMTLIKNDFKFLSGNDVEIIEKYWAESNKNKKVIMGQIAYRGKVTGRVKIIADYRKNNGFKKGDILVTGMTDPQFVPLIKLSAAIVTDGGGLLCHAAIVARELKIPCIIGTKFATKVLKDGQLVEVDANQGVVKIIKGANKK
jgi:phosphohistidine swiveling domain-containing protein/predicted outer membrane protein